MKADFFKFEEDFPYYVLWSRQRNRNFHDHRYLPINGVCVKDDNGRQAAIAFLYITDAGFGSIDTVMTSPLNDKILNREAVLMAIKFLVNVAEALKLGFITGVTNHPRLLEFYKELGFNEGERDLIQVVRVIKCHLFQ